MTSVSVILNNYNYARFLRASINSVLVQSYPDFELIVIDDGSTDESREIIAAYRDQRITAVFQPNSGQGSALAAGIGLAKGEYIAFLDSDDVWYPGKLLDCTSILQRYPDVSLLVHRFEIIDREGTVSPPPTRSAEGFFDQWAAYRRLEKDLPYEPTSFIMTRRDYVKRVRFRPAEWRISADTPLLAGLSVMGRVYLSANVLGAYRRHGANNFEGNQDEASLVALSARFYRSLNEHLSAQPSATLYDFERSAAFLAQQVIKTRRWSWSGLMARRRYRVAKRQHQ